MRRLVLLAAAALPVLGIAALVAFAEVRLRSGRTWIVDIAGYDPRDIIAGHYLRYRFAFRWDGADSCGAAAGRRGGSVESRCCLCLDTDPHGRGRPRVRNVRCGEVAACAAWLGGAKAAGEQRYFVPEARARELESRVQSGHAAVEMVATPGGAPAVGRLLVDGRPALP